MEMQEQEDELLGALELLAALLAKYRNGGQAHFVEHLIGLLKGNNPDFEKELASVSMWGGAGSVVDVPSFREKWMSRELDKEADADELRFRQAIIYLAQYMNKNRIGSDAARFRALSTADIFEQWTEKGL